MKSVISGARALCLITLIFSQNAEAAKFVSYELEVDALVFSADGRSIVASYQRTFPNQRIELKDAGPGSVVSTGSMSLEIPVGPKVVVYQLQASKISKQVSLAIWQGPSDENVLPVSFLQFEEGQKVLGMGVGQMIFPQAAGKVRADMKVRNVQVIHEVARKCAAVKLNLSFQSGGSKFNCSGPMPEAQAGARNVWGASATAGNMTGRSCRYGNVQGAHNHVLRGESAGVCQHYCTLIADCGEDGVYKNIRYTW
jgi:hypothetical protein